MSEKPVEKIEVYLQIPAKGPINAQELADELTEVIRQECPEVVDFKIKVANEPQTPERES
jgi:hypothetical protein